MFYQEEHIYSYCESQILNVVPEATGDILDCLLDIGWKCSRISFPASFFHEFKASKRNATMQECFIFTGKYSINCIVHCVRELFYKITCSLFFKVFFIWIYCLNNFTWFNDFNFKLFMRILNWKKNTWYIFLSFVIVNTLQFV